MAMWELAPGSPWNAIFSFLVMISNNRVSRAPYSSHSAFRQYLPRGFEIGGGVDPARDGIDDCDVDPHAGFHGPKLLEPFLPFQRRRRQFHKALQRRAPVSIETDMMVARPLAMRGGRAGEIKGAHSPPAERGAYRLHHVGIEAFFLGVNLRSQRRDIDGGILQRGEHVADVLG